jgi:hypothetical protein
MKRILRTGRPLTNRKEPGHGVQTIGHTQQSSAHRLWHRTFETDRGVVVSHRRPQLLVLAFEAQVMTAHDALELREFIHHVGQQIGFCEGCGGTQPFSVDIRVDCFRNRHRQLTNPGRLVRQGPQHTMEFETFETPHEVLERVFAVLSKKETCVSQPRSDNPLVALSDQPLGVILAIDDADESVLQSTVPIFENEAFLVVAEGRYDHLRRQLEESLLEDSGDEPGPLHKLDVLGNQVGIRVDLGTGLRGQGLRQLFEPLPAMCRIHYDATFVHCLFVVLRCCKLEALRRMHPVADGGSPGSNTEEVKRHYLVVEQCNDPVNRPYENLGTLAPPHHLRKAEGRSHRGYELAEDLRSRATFVDHRRGEVLALFGLHPTHLVKRHTNLAGKSLSGRCRVPVGVDRHTQRRTGQLLGAVSLSVRQVLYDHR